MEKSGLWCQGAYRVQKVQSFAGICGDVRGVSPLNSVGAHVRKLKAIPYSTIRSRVTAGIDHIRRQLTVKGIYQTLGEVPGVPREGADAKFDHRGRKR